MIWKVIMKRLGLILFLLICYPDVISQEYHIVGDDLYKIYGEEFNWDEIKASSFLVPDNKKYSKDYYDVSQINDGNEDTAWVEGVKGSGIGEWVKMIHVDWIRKKKYCMVNSVWIKNGYMKNRELYYANNRVKKIRIEFSEGEKKEIELKDGVFDYQIFKLGEIKTKWVKVVILDAYKGKKHDDTCISELQFWCYDKDWYKWGGKPIPKDIE